MQYNHHWIADLLFFFFFWCIHTHRIIGIHCFKKSPFGQEVILGSHFKHNSLWHYGRRVGHNANSYSPFHSQMCPKLKGQHWSSPDHNRMCTNMDLQEQGRGHIMVFRQWEGLSQWPWFPTVCTECETDENTQVSLCENWEKKRGPTHPREQIPRRVSLVCISWWKLCGVDKTNKSLCRLPTHQK